MKNKSSSPKEPLVHLTKRMDISPLCALGVRVLAFLFGMIICGLVAFLLIERLNDNPERIGEFYQCFIKGPFSTRRKLWKFLKNSAVLLCIALALAPAFRMRFWNTGAEGQTLVGVLGAIAVNFYLGGKIPEWQLLVLMLFASLLCGAIWAIIPAVFKAKWGTNETLFTLMMNYVATYLVSYFLVVWVPNGSSSLGKLSHGKLPSFYHDYLLIILIVLGLTILLHIYLTHSKHGYEISVVGESENTARYVGINVNRVIIRTMLLSGLLCGLAGYLIGAGLDQSITPNSVGGQGFTAIMVAWMAKFNPFAMVITSSLISALGQGAEQISQDFNVSGAFPDVIIGIVLFFIIASEFFINYEIHFHKRHNMAKEVLKG
ncbi:MAG: ABC transporter permease [Christensenellales bacterium]